MQPLSPDLWLKVVLFPGDTDVTGDSENPEADR